MNWVRPMRLPICLAAGLLSLASFRIAHAKIDWLAVATVVIIAISSMLQNDWNDRFQDRLKGKSFASDHAMKFFWLVILFWLITVILISLNYGRAHIYLLAVMAIMGFVYSEFKKLPFVPLAVVATISSAPALLPLISHQKDSQLWWLFLTTCLFVVGREIIKDLEDKASDTGYKWTIPACWGDSLGKTIIIVVMVLACMLARSLLTVAWLPLTPIIIGSILLIFGARPATSKLWFDLGMASVVILLIARTV